MEKLIKSIGNPVDGQRFFNRDVEMAEFRELLEEGANVLLVAPRRVGKTSLMREMARRLGDDWICIHLDVEAEDSPEGLVVKLATAAYTHQRAVARVKHVFRGIFSRVDSLSVDELSIKLKDALFGGWKERGAELVAELAQADRPVVVFIDELPILINRLLAQDPDTGRDKADALMSWLRAVSLRHVGRVRFVIAGSIGLGPVLESVNLSATANHLTPLLLGPWSAETGKRCLQALGRQYAVQWGEGALDAAVECLGAAIPHHVQVLFGRMRSDAMRRGSSLIAASDVRRVYRAEVVGTAMYRDLIHYEERLTRVVGGEHTPFALDLLTLAAVQGTLSEQGAIALARSMALDEPEAVCRRILHILGHDGYLVRDGGHHRFLSNLLRDFWRARFGASWEARQELRRET